MGSSRRQRHQNYRSRQELRDFQGEEIKPRARISINVFCGYSLYHEGSTRKLFVKEQGRYGKLNAEKGAIVNALYGEVQTAR